MVLPGRALLLVGGFVAGRALLLVTGAALLLVLSPASTISENDRIVQNAHYDGESDNFESNFLRIVGIS